MPGIPHDGRLNAGSREVGSPTGGLCVLHAFVSGGLHL